MAVDPVPESQTVQTRDRVAISLATEFLAEVKQLLLNKGIVLGPHLEAAMIKEGIIDMSAQAIIVPRYGPRTRLTYTREGEDVTLEPWRC